MHEGGFGMNTNEDSPLCREDFLTAGPVVECKSDESAAMVHALETCAMIEKLMGGQYNLMLDVSSKGFTVDRVGINGFGPTLHAALKHAVEAKQKLPGC
jgi:hypothetical protein